MGFFSCLIIFCIKSFLHGRCLGWFCSIFLILGFFAVILGFTDVQRLRMTDTHNSFIFDLRQIFLSSMMFLSFAVVCSGLEMISILELSLLLIKQRYWNWLTSLSFWPPRFILLSHWSSHDCFLFFFALILMLYLEVSTQRRQFVSY